MTATVDRAAGADLSALYVFGGAGACALVLVGMVWGARPASAVPSFARQTGQPCATCHNGDFPQLTPYGRQFKLNGYTAGGTRCRDRQEIAAAGGPSEVQIPISGMVVATFIHTQKDIADAPTNRKGEPNGLGTNDNAMIQDTSVFLAGQLYCNLGAFVQATYDRPDEAFGLDNADIRYASKTKIGGADVVYGIDANNNPSVEDPWNTTPAWRMPGDPTSPFAPGPSATPQIDNLGTLVAGAGAYAWVNNEFYAFVSAYRPLDRGTLQALGELPGDALMFDGAAPYWRLAVEKNWDVYSWMFGTYGMAVNIITDPAVPTDKFTDLGFDTQFQYLSGRHFITARASYTYEWQKLDGTFASGGSTNPRNFLSELNLSTTYSYNSTYTVTAGYFNNQGSADLALYGPGTDVNSPVNSPNTSGEVIDIGYLP